MAGLQVVGQLGVGGESLGEQLGSIGRTASCHMRDRRIRVVLRHPWAGPFPERDRQPKRQDGLRSVLVFSS